jgi:hypothetical protein
MKTINLPPRTIFDPDEFYYAVCGLVGRQPDERTIYSGLTQLIFKPTDTEKEDFPIFARAIGKWLDKYDIIFSNSICGYTGDWARDNSPVTPNSVTDVLRVRVAYPFVEDVK